ncbi:iron-containing redox enzyme family protein [Streptomyces physcomitrii]|uniref:iron-containing redox enzyme family protein n=1 Tax=Streptomyces physcomitrii TaxID=2724184 RepID=UPI003400F75A
MDTLTARPAPGDPGPAGPRLPEPRGPLSEAVVRALRTAGPVPPAVLGLADEAEPWGEDLHLALYTLYELHYRGFADVGDDREWDPELLRLRGGLERRYLAVLRASVPGGDPARALDALTDEAGPAPRPGLSHHLARKATLAQVREYAALRSLYHLKEADPHAWVIPRLTGTAKAAMVAVEFDEFGAGRAEDIHARLFADLLADLGLDTAYGRYLDRAPAAMLAVVNLMSLFGLHRARRGALVGHFAQVETTSSPASRQLAAAMRRVGAGPAAVRFYTEHVEADAVHEQVVRHQVVGGLLREEPWLAGEIGFGVEATALVEDRFGEAVLGRWTEGESALRPAA